MEEAAHQAAQAVWTATVAAAVIVTIMVGEHVGLVVGGVPLAHHHPAVVVGTASVAQLEADVIPIYLVIGDLPDVTIDAEDH